MKMFMHYITNTLVIIIFRTGIIYAKIPNGDFENRTDGEPDSWAAFNVIQSTDKYSGNFSAKGIVDFLFNQLLAPSL